MKVASNFANSIIFAWVILFINLKVNCTPTLSNNKGEQIGQIILTDISINGNSIADPGCLKHCLAFQWFSVGQWFNPGTPFPPALSEIPEILFYSGVKHQIIKKTHIPLWVVSFSSCTLLSSILTTFSSSMILSSCVFSVMLDIDLELTDSTVIISIQIIYTICVLDILL